MIRKWEESDRWPVVRLMQRAKMGSDFYFYDKADGQCLVDEEHGQLLGYIRYDLGVPETHVRQIVVDPDHQGNGIVGWRLIRAVLREAKQFGSQGVEGFQRIEDQHLTHMFAKSGAVVDAGYRVRFPLTDHASDRARVWMARAQTTDRRLPAGKAGEGGM